MGDTSGLWAAAADNLSGLFLSSYLMIFLSFLSYDSMVPMQQPRPVDTAALKQQQLLSFSQM